MMEIKLSVTVSGMYTSHGACIEIPELFKKCFEPMKACDEPILMYALGELSAESKEAMVVMKTREDAADILATELASMIVSEMKKNDTHNGYKANA